MAESILEITDLDKGLIFSYNLGDLNHNDKWKGITIDSIQLPYIEEEMYNSVIYLKWSITNATDIILNTSYPVTDVNSHIELNGYYAINTSGTYPYIYGVPTFLNLPFENLDGGGGSINFSKINYKNQFQVSISSNTIDSNIYYTTNSVEPDETSNLYSQPVNIPINNLIKAKAFKEGFYSSNTESKLVNLDKLPSPKTSSNGSNAGNIKILNWNEYPEDTLIYFRNAGSTLLESVEDSVNFVHSGGNNPLAKGDTTDQLSFMTNNYIAFEACCKGYRRSNIVLSLNADGKTNLTEYDYLTGVKI